MSQETQTTEGNKPDETGSPGSESLLQRRLREAMESVLLKLEEAKQKQDDTKPVEHPMDVRIDLSFKIVTAEGVATEGTIPVLFPRARASYNLPSASSSLQRALANSFVGPLTGEFCALVEEWAAAKSTGEPLSLQAGASVLGAEEEPATPRDGVLGDEEA